MTPGQMSEDAQRLIDAAERNRKEGGRDMRREEAAVAVAAVVLQAAAEVCERLDRLIEGQK